MIVFGMAKIVYAQQFFLFLSLYKASLLSFLNLSGPFCHTRNPYFD